VKSQAQGKAFTNSINMTDSNCAAFSKAVIKQIKKCLQQQEK
jgi:hypothetical protein